jgi:hypothetical protein
MDRQQLLNYAKSIPPTPAVASILMGIEEARLEAATALKSLRTLVVCANAFEVSNQELYEVRDTVQTAVKYERAHAKLSVLFLTLAQTLQGTGHKIDF